MLSKRLRHKGRVNALLNRYFFDHGAESHDVVSHGEGVSITKVDLVLAGSAFVVTELDRDAQLLKHRNSAASEVVSRAAWDVVEVSSLVNWNRFTIRV